MTQTLLPSGNCLNCGKEYQHEHCKGEDPPWFEDVIYRKGKPTKPFKTLMKWIDSGLCGKCYLKEMRDG